jgi:hypothetical protein
MIGVFEVLLESRTTDRARLSRNEPSANSETPSTDRACPVPSAAHFSGLLRKRKNMGRALPSRKLRKTIATAWLQLLGVQQTRFPEPRSQTLVNSARFDKTGGYLHSFRSVERFWFDDHRHLSVTQRRLERYFAWPASGPNLAS